MGSKIAWYGYVFLLPMLGVARWVEKASSDTGGFASRYLPFLFLTLFAVGIWGSLQNKAIGRAWLWKIVFWLAASLTVLLLAAVVYAVSSGADFNSGTLAMVLMLAAAIFPAQQKLWQYGYRSPGLWGGSN